MDTFSTVGGNQNTYRKCRQAQGEQSKPTKKVASQETTVTCHATHQYTNILSKDEGVRKYVHMF